MGIRNFLFRIWHYGISSVNREIRDKEKRDLINQIDWLEMDRIAQKISNGHHELFDLKLNLK